MLEFQEHNENSFGSGRQNVKRNETVKPNGYKLYVNIMFYGEIIIVINIMLEHRVILHLSIIYYIYIITLLDL